MSNLIILICQSHLKLCHLHIVETPQLFHSPLFPSQGLLQSCHLSLECLTEFAGLPRSFLQALLSFRAFFLPLPAWGSPNSAPCSPRSRNTPSPSGSPICVACSASRRTTCKFLGSCPSPASLPSISCQISSAAALVGKCKHSASRLESTMVGLFELISSDQPRKRLFDTVSPSWSELLTASVLGKVFEWLCVASYT